MKVAILCGGRGTRIREVSDILPKPMVPIGGKPILWHIMKIYASQGFNEFVLLLGYKGDIIREFFLNFALHTSDVTIDLNRFDSGRIQVHNQVGEPWKVTLVDTGEESMTGARFWRAREYLEQGDGFLGTYGDGVGNIDLASLVSFHKNHGKTVTLTGVAPPGRFGELNVENGAVKAFEEKPVNTDRYINGGFFVFNPNFIKDYLTPDPGIVLERGPFEKLAKDKELMMFEHNGFWQPMDTPREFHLLNELWQSGKAPWKIW